MPPQQRRRSSTNSNRPAPQRHHSAPRLAPPTNPPDPPLTLLHPEPIDPEEGRREAKAKPWSRRILWVGSGMYYDVKHRLPYYWSDWTDAWNYRVVPATWVSGAKSFHRATRGFQAPSDRGEGGVGILRLMVVHLLCECLSWYRVQSGFDRTF